MAAGYRQIGDAWVYLIIAHEWGHAIQARLQADQVSVAAELQADCLAGATLFGAADRGLLQFEQGDTEELAQTLAAVADDFPWTKESDHGDAQQRTASFNRGRPGRPPGLPAQPLVRAASAGRRRPGRRPSPRTCRRRAARPRPARPRRRPSRPAPVPTLTRRTPSAASSPTAGPPGPASDVDRQRDLGHQGPQHVRVEHAGHEDPVRAGRRVGRGPADRLRQPVGRVADAEQEQVGPGVDEQLRAAGLPGGRDPVGVGRGRAAAVLEVDADRAGRGDARTVAATSGAPDSTSAVTGTATAAAIRPTAPASSSSGSRSPSGTPRLQATAPLVVATAAAPARSTRRADATSQALGRTSTPWACSWRNSSARVMPAIRSPGSDNFRRASGRDPGSVSGCASCGRRARSAGRPRPAPRTRPRTSGSAWCRRPSAGSPGR